MIIEKASVTEYSDAQNIRSFRFYTNCFWVEISLNDPTRTLIFERKPDRDDWLDEAHQKITTALNALELAITEAALEAEKQHILKQLEVMCDSCGQPFPNCKCQQQASI